MSDVVWMRDRPAPRRQAPSVEQIVAKAIAIADAEGLAAVSMRRVAGDLGSGTASLYRYVTNRDELLDLMIDAVAGERSPAELTGDWRTDLTAVAQHTRADLLRHHWLAAELVGRPALGPNTLRRGDIATAAGLQLTSDVTVAGQAVSSVRAYVLGAVATELAEIRAERRTGMTEDEWRASFGPYIRRVIDSGDYPHLTRWIVDADDLPADERFLFGLNRILDGLAAHLG